MGNQVLEYHIVAVCNAHFFRGFATVLARHGVVKMKIILTVSLKY